MQGFLIGLKDLKLGLIAKFMGDLQGFGQEGFADATVLVFRQDAHVMDVETAVIVSQPGSSGRGLILIGYEDETAMIQSVLHCGKIIRAGWICQPCLSPDLQDVGEKREFDLLKALDHSFLIFAGVEP